MITKKVSGRGGLNIWVERTWTPSSGFNIVLEEAHRSSPALPEVAW